ncbi:hypothetical protein ACFLU6_05800 [Acidobacteriota bacterium]
MYKTVSVFVLLFLAYPCIAAARAPAFDKLIHAYKDGSDVVLEWNPAQNADGYNIYRFDSLPGPSPWPLYAAVPTPVFRDINATNDPADLLYYIVTAYNVNGETEALNWAFRLNYRVEFFPGSLNNQPISLPYLYYPSAFPILSPVNDEDLCWDTGDPPKTQGISRWDQPRSWYYHSCGSVLKYRVLSAAESYVLNPYETFTFHIVASHDPDYEPGGSKYFPLYCPPGSYCNNWISVPYHSMATTAQELCDELISRGHDIRTVNKWFADQDTYFIKTCGSSIRDFDLTPGLGIMIQPGRDESIQIEVH